MSEMNQALDHDAAELKKMGYEQELHRHMSGFSNFAISFSIICILAGGISAFPQALGAGGAASISIGWLVGGLFTVIVALAMAQISSSYPTAGGLYHWGSILGGKLPSFHSNSMYFDACSFISSKPSSKIAEPPFFTASFTISKVNTAP